MAKPGSASMSLSGKITSGISRRAAPLLGVAVASTVAENMFGMVLPSMVVPVHTLGSAAFLAVLIKPELASMALKKLTGKKDTAEPPAVDSKETPNLLEPEFVGLEKLKELVDHAIANGEKGIWVIQDPESGNYLAQTDSQFAITEKRFLEGDQPFVKMYMSANGGMKREVVDPVKLREEQKAAPAPVAVTPEPVPASPEASEPTEPETVIVSSKESPAAGAMFGTAEADDDTYDDDEEYGFQP